MLSFTKTIDNQKLRRTFGEADRASPESLKRMCREFPIKAILTGTFTPAKLSLLPIYFGKSVSWQTSLPP